MTPNQKLSEDDLGAEYVAISKENFLYIVHMLVSRHLRNYNILPRKMRIVSARLAGDRVLVRMGMNSIDGYSVYDEKNITLPLTLFTKGYISRDFNRPFREQMIFLYGGNEWTRSLDCFEYFHSGESK